MFNTEHVYKDVFKKRSIIILNSFVLLLKIKLLFIKCINSLNY